MLRVLVLAVCTWVGVGFACADPTDPPGLTIGTLPAGKTSVLTRAQLHDVLVAAEARSWNLFDLILGLGNALIPSRVRIAILGDDLRAEALAFDLGGRRVEAFLPVRLVTRIELGSPQPSGAAVEVSLSQTVSQFLELGDFVLETRYGFRSLSPQSLDDAYGVTVKSGIFAWPLQNIARVADPTGKGNPHFVAISLHSLFKPKRWVIAPIVSRPGAGSKP